MLIAIARSAWLLWSLANDTALAVRVFDDGSHTLRTICNRESPQCSAVGIHAGDSVWSHRVHSRAVAVGILRPATCIWHSRGNGQRWSTRGAFGMMAAYSMQYLSICAPPEVLDIPIVSAYIAAKRLQVARKRGAPRRLVTWCGASCIR